MPNHWRKENNFTYEKTDHDYAAAGGSNAFECVHDRCRAADTNNDDDFDDDDEEDDYARDVGDVYDANLLVAASGEQELERDIV